MPKTEPKKETIRLISGIYPADELESFHKEDAISWISSGAQLFRISKPDNPPKHLVSYFVPYDETKNMILLIDHINSGLWLPPGGHVEINENPKSTVIRGIKEELGITANFNTKFGDKPVFVSVTKTIGQGNHTDVSLWYVTAGDINEKLNYEKREMYGYKWYTTQEILGSDISKFDPNMHRFTNKFLQKV